MEYLSLYDYLGRAAGEILGAEVATAAGRQGIPTKTREVSNPKFTGTVFLYPKDFLEFYFRAPQDLPSQINHDIDDDDLPF